MEILSQPVDRISRLQLITEKISLKKMIVNTDDFYCARYALQFFQLHPKKMGEQMMATNAETVDDQGDDGAHRQLNSGLMGRRLSFRLRGLLNLLGNRVVASHAPFGLRSGSFTSMALIAANPGCSQIDLAREGGLDRSALVSIVDELERRGLAIRARSPIDRRRSSLYITPEGEKIMEQMFAAAMTTETSIRNAFTAEEMTQFFEFLERAYQILAREDR